MTADLEVPTLQGFGVDEATFRKAVPRMATDALASGSPGNNPVVPSQAGVAAGEKARTGAPKKGGKKGGSPSPKVGGGGLRFTNWFGGLPKTCGSGHLN